MSDYMLTQLSLQIALPLTKDRFTTIDLTDDDLSVFNWYCLMREGKPYARRDTTSGGERVSHYIHRIVLERTIERVMVKGEVVDHIDGDSLNNSRSNLRIATVSQNCRNRRISTRNSTGLKGAMRCSKGGYSSSICLDGKSVRLGYFKTVEDAHNAYCEAVKKYYGEFGRFG